MSYVIAAAQVVRLEDCIQGLMHESDNILSLLRDIKLLSSDKSVDLSGVFHVAPHFLNVGDIIISVYDKLLLCDVIDLI